MAYLGLELHIASVASVGVLDARGVAEFLDHLAEQDTSGVHVGHLKCKHGVGQEDDLRQSSTRRPLGGEGA